MSYEGLTYDPQLIDNQSKATVNRYLALLEPELNRPENKETLRQLNDTLGRILLMVANQVLAPADMTVFKNYLETTRTVTQPAKVNLFMERGAKRTLQTALGEVQFRRLSSEYSKTVLSFFQKALPGLVPDDAA